MEVKLKHRTNSSELTVILRPFEDGDADDVIACIRDEYGDTYFKRNFYNSEFLKKMHREGAITFLVAQTDWGEIAGILALKSFYPAETMCEVASEIFRKKFRGYRLAEPMLRYGLDIIAQGSYSAAYALPVTFHRITQQILQNLGMTATGFIFSVFRTECMESSYDYGGCQKHSQGIQIMPMEKTDTGSLYLPEELTSIAELIYSRLGVDYEICHAETSLKAKTRLYFTNDTLHRNGTIMLLRPGADLKLQVDQVRARYQGVPLQTFNVFLNISDPAAPEAYRILKESGFFFTGFKPLCSEREYLVMHDANGVAPHTEDYALSNEFEELLDDISPFIKVRG
ncbi:MAG TPA: hypothetical protein VHR42_06880 [Clostridia bacterium]|nr:hypothetical protein [Clostridia bacterium]